MLAYTFLDVIWSMFVFFLWLVVIVVEIMILIDNFRRQDHSGLAKAGWTVLIIFVPLVGALFYIVTRPKDSEITA